LEEVKTKVTKVKRVNKVKQVSENNCVNDNQNDIQNDNQTIEIKNVNPSIQMTEVNQMNYVNQYNILEWQQMNGMSTVSGMNYINDMNAMNYVSGTNQEVIQNNVNQQDYLGNTALHYAIEIHAIHLIHTLMTKKPDIRIRNNEGKSAFDCALEIPDVNIKHEILDMIINPDTKNPKMKIEIDKKYIEEIQKTVIPYANNDYPDFVSTNLMEEIKKDVFNNYKRKNSNRLSKEIIVLILAIILVIVYNIVLKV